MNATEASVEAEIQAKGLNAPRLTPQMIDDQIVGVFYQNGSNFVGTPQSPSDVQALECLTICVLVLKNGFTVIGKSACASSENFDAELGRKIAREDARRQIWALEGYALRKQLAAA